MKSFLSVVLIGLCNFMSLHGQELYVFSEPASNMPARSISTKLSAKFNRMDATHNGLGQRYAPELMFGLNKKWMVHVAGTFSDMYSHNLRFESARLYAKYRFLSNDQVHRHFRMAAFGLVSASRNQVQFDELSLEGDQGGVQAGLIATQLINKLAISATGSVLQVLSDRPKIFPDGYTYTSFNYSFSAGYLVLPLEYTSYRQTNLNVYAELLGQQSIDQDRYFIDFAPALQLIFNSTYKLNLGYRFQLNGNMYRMADNSFMISFESVFLIALKKRRQAKP